MAGRCVRHSAAPHARGFKGAGSARLYHGSIGLGWLVYGGIEFPGGGSLAMWDTPFEVCDKLLVTGVFS
jgi:hypothetical protein